MDAKLVRSVDKANMFGVLRNFHAQVKAAINIGSKADLTKFDKYSMRNIIITGLGGSAIGGDLIRSYTQYEGKIPVFVNRNYTLPSFAGTGTLVIVSSYSGNTEETTSAYLHAIENKCSIICITSGGEVEKIAKKNKHTLIKIPGGLQPRCALGYSFFVLYSVFAKLGIIKYNTKDLDSTLQLIENTAGEYTNLSIDQNRALKIALAIKGKLPVIYSSADLLDVVNLRWRAQLSENAKILAYGNLYPEMNHNELVGWKLNEDILKKIVVIYLRDDEDNERIKLRMDITSGIIGKYSDNVINISSDAKGKLERIFDLVYLGDWVSFYLAILNGVDPTPVDIISFLKKKLERIRL